MRRAAVVRRVTRAAAPLGAGDLARRRELAALGGLGHEYVSDVLNLAMVSDDAALSGRAEDLRRGLAGGQALDSSDHAGPVPPAPAL